MVDHFLNALSGLVKIFKHAPDANDIRLGLNGSRNKRRRRERKPQIPMHMRPEFKNLSGSEDYDEDLDNI